MSDTNSAEVPQSLVTDATLSEIKSFDDALAVVNDVFGGEIIDAGEVLGSGFGVADEKAVFVGVPFVIMRADRHVKDNGRFWSLHIVTKDGRKVIINDGGTGIAAQLDALYDNHPDMQGKPMMVRRGLRVSNYVHPEHGPSVTFYLDTSASV